MSRQMLKLEQPDRTLSETKPINFFFETTLVINVFDLESLISLLDIAHICLLWEQREKHESCNIYQFPREI